MTPTDVHSADFFAESLGSSDYKILTDILEKLMDEIYDAIGVRVAFSDPRGTPLAYTGYQCDFCRRSLEAPELAVRCRRCSGEAVGRAGEHNGVIFYRCWRGLMGTAVQVRTDERVLGCFIISGYICSPGQMEKTEPLFYDPAMQISEEEKKNIPFIRYEHVHDMISTVSIAARYLAEVFRRKTAEDEQRKAEFRALQSQISPHFLFNTLNSISQTALLEGAEKTPEAIYSLAALLRRTMKQNTGLVPLEEELAFVREYVHINQLLGRDGISYEERLDPGTADIPIPAFTIQPLVENSLKHGLEPIGGKGTVSVTVRLESDSAVITVEDNGAGFDPNKVSFSSSGELSGIGLSNVLGRLELFYGRAFHYEMHSAPGKGTRITLRIPSAK